jgi:hypothetical protein
MPSKPTSRKLTKSERGQKSYTRAYFDLWQLALSIANDSGKLSFKYDPHNPKLTMTMIKKKGTQVAKRNYTAVNKIFLKLKELNEEKIETMKKNEAYNPKVSYNVPE